MQTCEEQLRAIEEHQDLHVCVFAEEAGGSFTFCKGKSFALRGTAPLGLSCTWLRVNTGGYEYSTTKLTVLGTAN